MGVHNLNVYPEVHRLFEIPEDEPLFVLRAQDLLYPAAIGAYQALYMGVLVAQGVEGLADEHWAFVEHLEACRSNGQRWQRRNTDRLKVPD